MGEVIRFIQSQSASEPTKFEKPMRDMTIFLPADPISEQQNKAPVSRMVSSANSYRSDGVLS